MFRHVASSLLVLALCLFATSASKAETPSLDTRRAQFNQLLKDEWGYELKESPERATVVGDYRYNDRWSDNSLAHVQQVKHDLEDCSRNLTRSKPADLTSKRSSATA